MSTGREELEAQEIKETGHKEAYPCGVEAYTQQEVRTANHRSGSG
jgi:hypothetical protein